MTGTGPSTLLSSYETPAFRYGDSVTCEVRGGVVITERTGRNS